VADREQRTVHVDGAQARLTPTEFRLLVMLMEEPRRVFTREQIIQRVFGYDFDGFDRTVDAHISSLRRKLQRPGDKSDYMHTVYGVGYKFGDA
jgi:two-component system OmpR family response regulator